MSEAMLFFLLILFKNLGKHAYTILELPFTKIVSIVLTKGRVLACHYGHNLLEISKSRMSLL